MIVYDTASMNVKRSLSPRIVATAPLCPFQCQHRFPEAEGVLGGDPAAALVCVQAMQPADLYERPYQLVRLLVTVFHSLAARSRRMCCPVAVRLPELLLRLLSGATGVPFLQRNISGSGRGESGTSSSVWSNGAGSSSINANSMEISEMPSQKTGRCDGRERGPGSTISSIDSNHGAMSSDESSSQEELTLGGVTKISGVVTCAEVVCGASTFRSSSLVAVLSPVPTAVESCVSDDRTAEAEINDEIRPQRAGMLTVSSWRKHRTPGKCTRLRWGFDVLKRVLDERQRQPRALSGHPFHACTGGGKVSPFQYNNRLPQCAQ